MYWEKKYPRLLTNDQLQTVANIHKKLIAIADITCDIGGSIECVTHATSNEKPFYLYGRYSFGQCTIYFSVNFQMFGFELVFMDFQI
jgi:alanine dehydrogenase